MLSRPSVRRLAALVAAGLLVAVGCTTKTDETSSGGGDGGGDGDGDVATGPGVTDDTITLGVLSDLSGVFAAQGRETLQGVQQFWNQRNDEGGVCGREVELVVEDHGYNTQTAVTQYGELEQQVLAIQTLLGSPMTTALVESITADQILTLPSSWAPDLLDYESIIMAGTPYDLDMANAAHWLMENEGLAEGDAIGHIYLEGEYGESALAGTEMAAEELGLEAIGQEVQPSDNDLTAQVTSIQRAGARHIMLSTTGAQVASAVSVAEASGLDVTFVGSNVTFVPSLLDGPARAGLESSFYLVASFPPFGSDLPGPQSVRETYMAENPGANPTYGPIYGSGVASILYQVLERACEDGDLTREGLLAARSSLEEVDTEGLIAPLNLGELGQPPSRESYLSRPDVAAPGGLTLVEDLFAAPFVTDYSRSD